MCISKAFDLKLEPGRYDGGGNIYFETNWLTVGFGVAAQIEILETLQDSLVLNESEKNAFNIILEMLYAQESKQIKYRGGENLKAYKCDICGAYNSTKRKVKIPAYYSADYKEIKHLCIDCIKALHEFLQKEATKVEAE